MSSGDERRLFFALWPDEGVRADLAESARAWLIDGAVAGRRVPAANLHLTLAYLGPVAAARVGAVGEAVMNVPLRPFRLCIDAGGWWPRPQVAWLAPTEIPLELASLEAGLWTRLNGLGWRRDHPRFAPHITVARKRREPPPSYVGRSVSWEVNEYVLCESVSTGRGVRYDVLARWPG